MEQNPYQPPAVALPTLDDEQPPERGPRPFGIWILSGLHLLAGFLFIFATWYVTRQFETDDDYTSHRHLFLAVSCAVMALFSFASSLGMWLGTKWGWWLAAFYYVWSALGALVQIPLDLWSIGLEDIGNDPHYVTQRFGNLVISALIALYFFRRNVRDFFGLASLRILYALLLLGTISLILLAGTIAYAFFAETGK